MGTTTLSPNSHKLFSLCHWTARNIQISNLIMGTMTLSKNSHKLFSLCHQMARNIMIMIILNFLWQMVTTNWLAAVVMISSLPRGAMLGNYGQLPFGYQLGVNTLENVKVAASTAMITDIFNKSLFLTVKELMDIVMAMVDKTITQYLVEVKIRRQPTHIEDESLWTGPQHIKDQAGDDKFTHC
ncbi:uncharacterized protein BJ212DRAFT_1304674 [Suillus subaureus]|uniref:Uncharacterized protein n=1 Tax=Suillus subaureus TaxID=48587 RepID=A0A9P7DUA2_9AGAM|nr:uncharacterized protein BJ212DRAFT_1304674 [Suillus subaureus]KAG1803107.1 hypothetical protein BJ212DRAFT_1304674 [Suillus subaureus]